MNKERPEYDCELEFVIESFKQDFLKFTGDEKIQIALDNAAAVYESNSNVENLEKLIRLRFEHAKKLGKSCPAEVILERRHLSSSAKVVDFLADIKCDPLISEPKGHFTLSRAFNELVNLCKEHFGVDAEILNDFNFCGLNALKCSISSDDKLIGDVLFVPRNFPAHYTLQCRILDKQPAIVLITAPCKNPYKLSFRESQSIFHEFGHAMHSILSESRYQMLSGTRGSLEIAEIPSNLFECFHARCFGVEPEGIDRRDIELAIFDQKIHSVEPGKDGWIREMWPTSLPQVMIPHFATYGASYYVYPLGKFVARKLAFKDSSFFLENLFKRGGMARISDLLKP